MIHRAHWQVINDALSVMDLPVGLIVGSNSPVCGPDTSHVDADFYVSDRKELEELIF